MQTQHPIGPHIERQFDALRMVLTDARTHAEACGEAEDAATLRDRLDQLRSAALFVVVGEVKAGKSSFINAVLGEEVCEVAPDPCTSVIQELVYGPERSYVQLGTQWERIFIPQDVLRYVSIVDTPGTNSVLKNHQAITERYIPQSDLVVFVFPAKNPHSGSSWDLLELIRADWHRKTVFVLQQADLATEHELTVNTERVKQYARDRGVQQPIVFALSAKLETENSPDSGFEPFRAFLQQAVEDGEVWRLKIDGTRDTVLKVLDRIEKRLEAEAGAVEEERGFLQKLHSRVATRRAKATSLQRILIDHLARTYERLSDRLRVDFADGLRASTVIRRSIPILRDKSLEVWLRDLREQFERSASEDIEAETVKVSKDLSEEIQALLDELDGTISGRQDALGRGRLPVAVRREDLLGRLRDRLGGLRIADIVGEAGLQGSDLGTLALTGGGLAALGSVLALATKLVVFDITGGILATAGVALVAVSLLWKRNQILNDFTRQIEASRADFRMRLDGEVTDIFNRLFVEVEHAIDEPVARLDEQAARIAPLRVDTTRIIDATRAIS